MNSTLSKPGTGRRLLIAGGGVLVLVAVLIAGFAAERKKDPPRSPGLTVERKTTSDSVGPEGGPRSSVKRSSVAAPEPGPSPTTGDSGVAPGQKDRKVERTAALELAASSADLEQAARGVAQVTSRHRGFVLRSDVTVGDDGPVGGNFDLRVPTGELHDTIRDLGGLDGVEVRSRTESGNDVTEGFVTTQDRLDTVRAERRGLLVRLAQAKTDKRARVLRQRVNLASAQLRGLQSQVRNLRERTDFAVVEVTLERKGHSAPGAGVNGGVDDLKDSLVESVNIALRALGVLIPMALLLGFAWLVWKRARRAR